MTEGQVGRPGWVIIALVAAVVLIVGIQTATAVVQVDGVRGFCDDENQTDTVSGSNQFGVIVTCETPDGHESGTPTPTATG